MSALLAAVALFPPVCAGQGAAAKEAVPSTAVAADDARDRPRFQYLGWQVGLSYQAPRPEGKRPEELRALIREMRENGMNLLSIMLVSYSRFDNHDGFCWPTRRKSLRCYRDEHSLNANEKTEFLSQIIGEAKKARIHIQLMTNWGVWNPERITDFHGISEDMTHRFESDLPKYAR